MLSHIYCYIIHNVLDTNKLNKMINFVYGHCKQIVLSFFPKSGILCFSCDYPEADEDLTFLVN